GRPGLGEVGVEGAYRHAAELVVRLGGEDESETRVEDAEVDPELVHARVEEPREEGRGAVQGVAGGHDPPAVSPTALVPAMPLRGGVGPEPGWTSDQRRSEALGELGASVLLQGVEIVRHHLDEMAVAIDDRVAERTADGFGAAARHGSPAPGARVR